MEMEGLDEVYRYQRFLPTDQEAVGYFLRRLLTGETLNGAEKLIRHAEVYACEPKDLAREFTPVPTAVSSGDRFFFTTCRRGKNGVCRRGAGTGTWAVQTTEDVHEKGVKIGEKKKLAFKKNKKSTGWVMEEYRCLLPQAIVADGEKVLCRIHLVPNPPAAARQESDAYKLGRQEGAEPAPAPQPAEPVTVTAPHAKKRPAPVAAADMSSCKKMRTTAPVPVQEPEVAYEDCPTWFTPAASAQAPVPAADPPCSSEMWTSVPVPAPAPASDEEEFEDCPVWSTPAAPVSTSPAAYTEVPEADDGTGRYSCSWEELFPEEPEEEQTLPVEAEVQDIDQFVQSLFADDPEAEEQTTLPTEAQNSIQQLGSDEDMDLPFASDEEIDRFLAYFYKEEAELQKNMCSYTPSLQGQHNHFSSFGAVN